MPKLVNVEAVKPHTRPNGVGKNGKGSTGRPLKWGERKQRKHLALTPTACSWLDAQGGADFIEALARDSSI